MNQRIVEAHPEDKRRGPAPYPPRVYTANLDLTLLIKDESGDKDGPLPGLLPKAITGDCHQCSFLVPCPFHAVKLGLTNDTGRKVR